MKQLLRPAGPFRGVMIESIRLFIRRWVWYAWGTIVPILFIAWARFSSEDLSGSQNSVLIALLTVFISMVMARLAVSGRPKSVRLLAFYNGIMSRYLSAIGLIVIGFGLILPALGSVLSVGVALARSLPLWTLIFTLPLAGMFSAIAIGGGFALFALMDDMSISVAGAYRVSYRLARKFWLPLLRLLLILAGLVFVIFAAAYFLPSRVVEVMQEPFWQIWLEALVSLALTPLLFTLWARVYERMVEHYE